MTPQELMELLQDAGYSPRSYSGRGMYGKYCVGVVTSASGYELAMDLADAARNAGRGDLPGPPLSDDMGRETVYYWPKFPWPEDEL